MLRYVFVREPVIFNDKIKTKKTFNHAYTLHLTLTHMSPVHVLDRYYLAITALITVAWQLAGFFVAWTLQVRP
jgi:hypothetical protein